MALNLVRVAATASFRSLALTSRFMSTRVVTASSLVGNVKPQTFLAVNSFNLPRRFYASGEKLDKRRNFKSLISLFINLRLCNFCLRFFSSN